MVANEPVGGVSFVSRTFGRKISDKIIIFTQRSGFHQLLEHDYLVLDIAVQTLVHQDKLRQYV